MKQIKAHPLMILKLIKPFLFILIIPVIRALTEYIILKKITGFLKFELFAVFLIFIIGFLKLRSFKLKIFDNSVEITQGLIIKKTAFIKKEKISSVCFQKNPIDMVFKAITFCINTEAGKPRKQDFEIKLYNKDAEKIVNLLYKEENKSEIRFSLKNLIVSAALSSSAVTGLIVGIPIINRIGKLLDFALSEMLLSEINKTANRINTYFPPILNIITLVFLTGYVFSFIYSLLSSLKFKISIGKNRLEINHGIIINKRIIILKSNINNIFFEQTPLMRFAGYYVMVADVGGFEGKKEKAILIPTVKRSEIERQFKCDFAFLLSKGRIIRTERNKKSGWRFYRIPIYLVFLTVVTAKITSIIFPFFEGLIYFLSIIALFAIFYYAGLGRYNYRYGRLQLGENICVCGTNLLNTREMHFNRKKTGIIKITRNPTDLKNNTCKFKVTICSESADKVKIKYLNYDLLYNNIIECFKNE